MRVYKFLNEHFGLKDLRQKRLKQSRIQELNDPFELTPYDLTDPGLRQAFLATREDLGKARGMVCFSSVWSNPVVWAHYSDGQRGLCLGFDIPEISGDAESDESAAVNYIPDPLQFPSSFSELPEPERLEIVRKILFTKFDSWKYEEEVRIWAPLQNEEGGLHFLDFDDKLRLMEVIVGARSTIRRSAISRALGMLASQVAMTKARAAYDSFRMVEDERGLD